jgi:hypothetical protein
MLRKFGLRRRFRKARRYSILVLFAIVCLEVNWHLQSPENEYVAFLEKTVKRHPSIQMFNIISKNSSRISRKLFLTIEALHVAARHERNKGNNINIMRNIKSMKRLAEQGVDKPNPAIMDDRMTFVFNCQNECVFMKLDGILENISKTNYRNHPIVVATSNALIFEKILKPRRKSLPFLRILRLDQSKSLKDIYKVIIKSIKTKVIFLTRNLNFFAKTTNLKEISSLVFNDDVDAAGTSSISEGKTRVWDPGCFKTKTLLYQYKMVNGYDHISEDGILRCDYLTGPFIIRKSVLRRYLDKAYFEVTTSSDPMFHSPDMFFTSEIFYIDLFHYLQQNQYSVISSTNIALQKSYTDSIGNLRRRQYQSFLVKNQLNRVLLSLNQGGKGIRDLNYKCDDVNIHGGSYLMLTKNGMFIPKCAIDELNALLLHSTNIFDKFNYQYELDSGSVVGQTKLSATLPWERDHDLMFKPRYFRHLVTFNETLFVTHGYVQKPNFTNFDTCLAAETFECGYIGVRSKTWRIELVGQTILGSDIYRTQENPDDPKLIKSRIFVEPTKGEVGEQWVYTATNPGLYSRSKYGLDLLKHQQHWADVGGINSWHEYEAGKWMDCQRPGHHACCNNFLSDGNIIFKHIWI